MQAGIIISFKKKEKIQREVFIPTVVLKISISVK